MGFSSIRLSSLPTLGDTCISNKGTILEEVWQMITIPQKNTTMQGGLYEAMWRKENTSIEKKIYIELI